MLSSIFRPSYLKEADLLASNARKLLHRRRDLLTADQFSSYSAQVDELETAARDGSVRNRKEMEARIEKLDKSFGKIQTARGDAGIRENCEVLLVALVLAIGIRAYFLQPFKIPTGSMEPTLNGIIAQDMKPQDPVPGFLLQAFQYLWLGRTYVDAVSRQDDVIRDIQPVKHLGLLSYSRIICASGQYYDVYAPREKLVGGREDCFEVYIGRTLKTGESIVHGYVDTGDQVFVDKFTYNFRKPRREDVFVFSTLGIPTEHSDPNVKSEFYIKRLAGVPGDILRIAQLKLYVNGQVAPGPYFERVMKAQNGYRGYSNTIPPYLRTSTDTFSVGPDAYFALGDNSFNSSDSRHWGIVPAKNVVGRGLLVYYPFTKHWGLIH